MSIKYNYNRSGAERKALVAAVSQILEAPAVYLGAPTFAYAVGAYRISKKGSLFSMNNIGQEETERLVFRLHELGFVAENFTTEDTVTEENVTCEAAEAIAEGTNTAVMENSDGENTLAVEIPKADFTEVSLANLHKIIASKETLIKKALEADKLPVIDTGETLKFPWFTLHGLDGEADAYSRLIAAICKMAKERKRVVAKESDTENDKFTLRLFLVQLGFIGDKYKTARKILLKNLTGNSSWKSGHAPEHPAADTESGMAPDPQPYNTPEEETVTAGTGIWPDKRRWN